MNLKRIILFAVLSCVAFIGNGQNLVPNCSFEVHDTCPTAEDEAHYATGWYKCSGDNVVGIGNTTPDYYNSCSPSYYYGVPQGGLLYQRDNRHCDGFMGLGTQNSLWYSNYREHVGIALDQTLIVGQKYYLSFNTVMAGQRLGADYFDNPSNNIGMRLSTVAYSESNPVPIDNFAHLRAVSIITDTVNWIKISGSIIADSAYAYVMLGNFYDDANTDTLMYNCSGCHNYYSYYLVDDICVSTDSLFCNVGIDAMQCSVSAPEIENETDVNVFPNPVIDQVTVEFRNSQCDEIVLTDMFGKIYYRENVRNRNSVLVKLEEYPPGMYFLRVIISNGKPSTCRKIIKL